MSKTVVESLLSIGTGTNSHKGYPKTKSINILGNAKKSGVNISRIINQAVSVSSKQPQQHPRSALGHSSGVSYN